MSEHARHELARHRGGILGLVVESGHHGKDRGAGVGGQAHIADVNLVERRLAYAEDERALLLEADVGSALDQIVREPIGNAAQCSDRARKHDHRVRRVGSAGDVRTDVVTRLLLRFLRRGAEHLVEQVAAAGDLEFLGQDAQPAVRDDPVDYLNTRVGLDGTQYLAGENGAARAGDGESEIAGWRGEAHLDDRPSVRIQVIELLLLEALLQCIKA